jgi:hypothetical protein
MHRLNPNDLAGNSSSNGFVQQSRTEAVMALLLIVVGADTPTAVAATLICRLATLWFAVIIGGVAFAVFEANSKVAQGQAPHVRG